jgi:multicomponent Na+:H+ antiporter subunit E
MSESILRTASGALRRGLVWLRFSGHYLVELVRSSLRVAADVLTPTSRARPGIVRMPLDARTDLEIALVANLISLTPGTLTIDVAPDRSALVVHAMFLDGDEEQVVRSLKEMVERPVLELMR